MENDIGKIKQAIMSLSGGEFQSFCEQFLSLNGFSFISSKGSVAGTNSTKPGTPDHICIAEDGRYILVEDTTQKDKIGKKIYEDISKCVKEPKHRIPLQSIKQVIYCYNRELYDEAVIEKCKKECEEKGILFTFYGLEFFANELLNNPLKYFRLAQSSLKINLSWLGISSIDEFIFQNKHAQTSPTFENPFYGRESEKKDCIDALQSNVSIVLHGNPGTGKTRLALEVCKYLADYGYSVICLKGHSDIRVNEMMEAIGSLKSERIIILIDDANEIAILKAMHDVKDYCSKEVVFIATVRNYARDAIENVLSNFTNTKSVFIDSFSKEETKEFTETSFGIKNNLYIEAIYRLSKGNPRLIVLASDLALKNNNLNSISDASCLYDTYYKSITYLFHWDKNTLITLGILSFENRINLEKMDSLKPLFKSVNISEKQFADICDNLCKSEILEINHSVVYFTDQSFKCYIQKKVFVDEKVIPLRDIVEKLFFIHPNKTKNAINSLLSVFQNTIVSEFVSDEINAIIHREDIISNQNYSEFLAFFCPFFPMKVVKYIEEKMDSIAFCPLEDCIKILGILEAFVETNDVAYAIDKMFMILNKREELFDNISDILSKSFSYKHDSRLTGYITQESLLSKIEATLSKATPVELKLIKKIIPEYVKTHYHYASRGEREREVKLIQFDLINDTKLKELRFQAWRIIFSLPDYSGTIEKILYDYSSGTNSHTVDNQIGINDWNCIKEYAGSNFDKNNLLHCLIIDNLVELFPSIAESAIAKKFLSSKRFKLYKKLKVALDHSRPGFYRDIDYSKGFLKSLSSFGFEDMYYLFETISETKKPKFVCNLSYLVPSLLSLLVEKTKLNIFDMVRCCMDMGLLEEPYFIADIFQTMCNHCSDRDIFSFILLIDERYRNNWLWTYYSFKTLEQITDSLVFEFYNFLGTPDKKMTSMGFRSILNLNQYIAKDPAFVQKCLSIIVQNFQLAPFMYSNYLRVFFLKEPCEIVNSFGNNYELMINSYCLLASYDSFIEDHDGKFLAYISSTNKQVLEHYLEFIKNNKEHIRDLYGRLQSLWNVPNYIELADVVLNYTNRLGGFYEVEIVLSQFMGTLHVENKNECLERIKNWFFHLIDTCNNNQEKKLLIVGLFSSVPESIRNDCILHFIKVFDDIALFKKVEIVSRSYSWSGSKIPMFKVKIMQLNDLSNRIKEPSFMKYRIQINEEIEYYKRLIEEAEIEELLEDS